MKRILAMIAVAASMLSTLADVVTYPAPAGEPESRDYEVQVNGRKAFCYTSFHVVNDEFYRPFFPDRKEMKIKGRPVSPMTFCYFDFQGEVEVKVRMLKALEGDGIKRTGVVVRPLALGIKPEVRDHEFTFTATKPGQITIEAGGAWIHPLHIFANPLEVDPPRDGDPGVLYFGPGNHEVGLIRLQSNQTVYIAGGAIVHLRADPTPEKLPKLTKMGLPMRRRQYGMYGVDAENVTIRGRGIFCERRSLMADQTAGGIRAQNMRNLRIEGIIMREATGWTVNVVNSKKVHIDNVKVVGHYVGNDGILLGGTSDALVENCFLNNSDDSFEVKCWALPMRDVEFRNCIAWSNSGTCFGLSGECNSDVDNVAFRNCTVIHDLNDVASRGVIGVHVNGPGNVSDFLFEDIVIEHVPSKHRPSLKVFNNWSHWYNRLKAKPKRPYERLQNTYPKDENGAAIHPGTITNVTFRNIRVLEAANDDVVIMADGPQSPIRGVLLDNVSINGRKVRPGDPRIKRNEHVSEVTVRE